MTKSNVIAALILIVGVFCHTAGQSFTPEEQQWITHTAGGAFDGIFLLLMWAKRKRDGGGTPPAAGAIAGVLLIAAAAGAGGCETSKAFQVGASVVGQGITEHAETYVLANPTTLPAEQIDARAAQVENFRLATVDAAAVTYEAVRSGWYDMRDWYVAYVNTDPRLARMPKTLKYYRLQADVMTRMIQAEGIRRLIWADDAAVDAIAAEANGQ